MGIKEQLIFPEIDYDKIDKVRGMDICFVTTANTDAEAKAAWETMGDGTFVIDQERAYQCRFELTDLYGNRSTVEFVINGRPTDATPAAAEGISFDYQYD